MYISEYNDQAEPTPVLRSPPVPQRAARGSAKHEFLVLLLYRLHAVANMRARVLAKQKIDIFVCKFYGNIAKKDSSTPIRSDKTLPFLNFRWDKPIKSSVSIIAF